MSSTGGSGTKPNKRKNSTGNRTDPGWEHAVDINNNSRRVQCKYCGVIRSGGIYRFKHHLAGTSQNAEPCTKVPDDVRQKFVKHLKDQAESQIKKTKRVADYEIEEPIEIDTQKGKGTMDVFVKKRKNQITLNHIFKKEEREKVCIQIARLFYTSAIPFNVVKNPEFIRMLEMVGKYGVGLKPPSYNDIREKYLKKEVESTLDMLEEYKLEWKKTGCTIMSDGWTDKKRRSICNFLVNSPKGTVFLTSIDTSEISKTADKVFDMLDEVIEKVGEENVVQVVTDNAANYKLAGEKLMEKRKGLYWTPCAAHCIDLMLEDFEKKIELHKVTIAKGRSITTFIYSRTMLICWLKKFTRGKDLIRPAVTRFATAYLTLGCLNDNQGALISMFSSSTWKSSKYAASKQGRKIQIIALDSRGFWKNVLTCLKAANPLIKVLRLVDSDVAPAMGFIYEAMDRAKEQIQINFKHVQKK
jgi:hypothetical protein